MKIGIKYPTEKNIVSRSDKGIDPYDIPDEVVSDEQVQRIFNMFWTTENGVKCKRCGDEMYQCHPYNGPSKEFPNAEKVTVSQRHLHSLSFHYYHPDCRENSFNWYRH